MMHFENNIVKKRLKLVYLLYLLIPLFYVLMFNQNRPNITLPEAHEDLFYTSIKSSDAVFLSFSAGEELLSSFEMSPGGFKNIGLVESPGPDQWMQIQIEGLQEGDTLSFLCFNLFSKGQLYSLYGGANKYCYAENALLRENDGVLNVISQGETPVIIKIKPAQEWPDIYTGTHSNVFVWLVFSVVFLLILFLLPPPRFFIIALLTSLLLMMVFKLFDFKPEDTLTITSESPQDYMEVFYNNNPSFTVDKVFSSPSLISSFEVPIALASDPFLRVDISESVNETVGLTFKISEGIFSNILETEASEAGKMVLNDLDFRGGDFYATGPDPYIALTSAVYLQEGEHLRWLNRNLYACMALLFFVLLLICQHIFFKKAAKTIGKSYLFVFLIPFTYFFIVMQWGNVPPSNSPPQVYFSAHSTGPAILTLSSGTDSLTSWELNDAGFKYLHYAGVPNNTSPLHLKIENLNQGDTVSFMSLNLYKDKNVFNIFENDESVCKVENATFVDGDVAINITPVNAELPIVIGLLPPGMVHHSAPYRSLHFIVLSLFLLLFVLVFFKKLPVPFVATLSFITSLLLFVFFWVSSNWYAHIHIKADSPLKSIQIFFNNNPDFLPDRKQDINSTSREFETEVELFTFPFLRCDVVDTLSKISNLNIDFKSGVLSENINFSSTDLSGILFNDMTWRDGICYVTGSDPFIVLTSFEQIKNIRTMGFKRQYLFLIPALLFFVLLVFFAKKSQKKNLSDFFFVAVFLWLLASGYYLRLLHSPSIVLSAEMRYAYTFPDEKVDTLQVFLNHMNKYLEDQVPARTNMIVMNNLIEYGLFGQLVDDPNVHFGEDGWLFYIGGLCRENYENRKPLTEDEMKKMTEVLLARRDWLRERGTEFYFFFPPMAYFVYEKEVGKRMWRYNKKSKVDQLYEYVTAHTDLNFIDMLTPLLEAKDTSKNDLFFRTNSHWNYHGSYVAYNALINKILNDFPDMNGPVPPDSIKWVAYHDYISDLYKSIAIDRYYEYNEIQPSRSFMLRNVETTYPIYPEFSSPAPAFSLNNVAIKSPSVLLYGDSYAGFLYYYMANNFSKGTYLWTPLFYPSIIETEKPDIVIQEMNDYSIYNLLYPNSPLPPLSVDTLE